jgi:hypothetical protein
MALWDSIGEISPNNFSGIDHNLSEIFLYHLLFCEITAFRGNKGADRRMRGDPKNYLSRFLYSTAMASSKDILCFATLRFPELAMRIGVDRRMRGEQGITQTII